MAQAKAGASSVVAPGKRARRCKKSMAPAKHRRCLTCGTCHASVHKPMATNQDACWPVCMLLGKSRQDCLARSAENLEDVDGGIAGKGPILQHKLPSLALGLFLGGSGLAVNSVGKWQQLRPKRGRAGEAAQCQRHLYKFFLPVASCSKAFLPGESIQLWATSTSHHPNRPNEDLATNFVSFENPAGNRKIKRSWPS